MTKRFTLDEIFMITDNECLEVISPLMNSKDVTKVCELLNELHEENENTKSILDDFMWIVNVLQANPNDTKRLGVARDMLENMGVLLYDK